MYASKLQLIEQMSDYELTGNLSLFTRLDTPPNYKPAQSEIIIYFVDYNSMEEIRMATLGQKNLFVKQAKESVQGEKVRSILIISISIISIILIGLAVLPLLSSISQRHC